MDFEEGIKKTLDCLKNIDVQNSDVIWEQLTLLERFLADEDLKLNENSEISCAFQGVLNIVLSSDVLNDYGISPKRTKCLERIFLRSLHISSFFAMAEFIKNATPSSKLDSVISILEKFFVDGSFETMCKNQCCVTAQEIKGKSAWKPIWEQLITVIVSLPNRIHNKNIQKTWLSFDLQGFSGIMSKSLYSSLEYVQNQLTQSCSVSLEFQSLLLGRLFITGYGDSIFKIVIPQLIIVLENYLWKKVVQRLILGIPEKYLESIITALLIYVPWYGYVENFIGNGGLENNTVKFILTKKLILIRFYEQPDILFKCIGYYASSPNRQTILLTVCENILDIWSKKTALKHQSERQHFYLSCGIMVCCAFLPTVQFDSKKSVFMKYLLEGVETHIDNSSLPVRVQGMVVGQTLTSILDPEGPKLSFEYDETEDTKLLMALINLPPKPEEISDQQLDLQNTKYIIKSNDKTKDAKQELLLDSDDDLEPYDQSNDTAFHKEKQPVYVQDVINGLADHSRTSYSNLCLNSAEKIIRSQPHYTTDVSEELAKILLHLEDTFAADNFLQSRFRAMVAATVVAPERVAKYFTQEFHNKNYNLRQRLDILEVLAAASQELAQCTPESKSSVNLKPEKLVTNQQAHWNDIIQKRIDSKTRRFGKQRQEGPKPVPNNFGSVAGTFFFPLLKDYDSPQNELDLLGENSYVLGRLIYTLGITCNSAANTLIFRQMAKAMLDFIWTLRYHVDAFVRQALLFSLCMVIANATPAMLTQDLQAEVYECQLWLKDILEKDPNKECQACAGKILTLIYEMLRNE